MSRIAQCFTRLQQEGRKALIPYVTAGDPLPENTVPLMHAMVEAGADIIELGVPFSDPMADGPVIQQACERALKHHVSLRQVIDMVAEFRQSNQHTPVVLMGYLNPVEIMGYGEFAEKASAAGVDGLLTVDLPPEESDEISELLKPRGIDMIFLLAPTSDAGRMQRISARASGFIYYVSLKGVTGAASLDVESVATKLQQIRQHTSLPLGVGFGIGDADAAAAVASVADAVVVGSALVKQIAAHSENPEQGRVAVSGILREMRGAMDALKAA